MNNPECNSGEAKKKRFATQKGLNINALRFKFNRFTVAKHDLFDPEFHSGLFMFNTFGVTLRNMSN
jgi:hypothetical protein